MRRSHRSSRFSSSNFNYTSPVKRSKGGEKSNHTIFDPNSNILRPEDITQSMINNIAERSGGKTYSANGTTCHQCR